ncbi:MAG: sensor histidine kinase [Lachnospiraceae bacterium]
MSHSGNIVSLFVTLFICTLDGYSMMNYRVPTKRAYGYFAAVTAVCLAFNSYITIHYGSTVLRSVILFTIGLPYFVLILLITKDKISQTVFNFWLWINIYDIIANFSAFINDYTLKDAYFLTALRFVLFGGYFILYNKHLKAKHRMLMDRLKVNWWIFSFIPMSFTGLICLVNYYFLDFHGVTRNYPVLLMICILMLLVYILIFYTFQTAGDAMERERIAGNMKEQILLQKKQYEFYLQKREAERIFRHDARHRDSILISYLENGDVEGAKEFLKKELAEIEKNAKIPFCENTLINAVLSEYRTKAEQEGLEFSARIQMPKELACDEAEFCVMLSNLLENSLDAAKSYIAISIKHLNHQLSLNVKNDYEGELKKSAENNYLTTKPQGSGLGLKSVEAILKSNSGFLKIEDTDGVFDVFATLKN